MFENTIPISFSVDTLTVSILKSFARDYIKSRFQELLEGALAKLLSPTSRLEIVAGLEDSTDNTTKKET